MKKKNKALEFRAEAIDEARIDESVESLAHRIGISLSTLHNWRHGRSTPSYNDVCRLAEAQGQPLGFYSTAWKGGERVAA